MIIDGTLNFNLKEVVAFLPFFKNGGCTLRICPLKSRLSSSEKMQNIPVTEANPLLHVLQD